MNIKVRREDITIESADREKILSVCYEQLYKHKYDILDEMD